MKKQSGEASVLFIIFCFLLLNTPLFIVNLSRTMFVRSDYTGVVQSEGNRLKLNSDGYRTSGTQKFSFLMVVNGKKLTMNCDDTRCAAIEKGNNVTLNCFEQVHLFSPNELECRFKQIN